MDGFGEALERCRRWRAKAEEIRIVAQSMSTESGRRTPLQIASDYEALADSCEKRIQQRDAQDRSGTGR